MDGAASQSERPDGRAPIRKREKPGGDGRAFLSERAFWSTGQEIADRRRNFRGMCLQREVTGVEEADDGARNVALEGFGAGRQEEGIVLAPYCKERRLVGAEIGLEGRIKRYVALIVAKQIELQLSRAGPGQIPIVE